MATGSSYTLSETVDWTTGSESDSVIFASLPMDRYVYRVVRHPDSDMMDREIIVDLPRNPVVLFTERDFYNANILEGAPRIGDDVFSHAIGDPESYPNPGQRNQLLNQYPGIRTSDSSPVSQGDGSTSLTLSLENSQSFTEAFEAGFSLSIEATGATILGGFEVGVSGGASLTTSMGSELTYSGTVGGISEADFATNFYEWGLFTYYYTDGISGQRFQVINYWVE